LIAYTPRASRQVDALIHHFEALERAEAIRGLIAALNEAEQRIDRNPDAGLSAPRPYPALARAGWAWVKCGRYWVVYSTRRPPVILGVFYETADIPGRL